MDNSNLTHAEQVFAFQIKRNITNLYKGILNIVAREKESHDESLEKLKEHLPAQYKNYVDLVDSLSDQKAYALRSEILGIGNDCIRELEAQYKILLEQTKGKGK